MRRKNSVTPTSSVTARFRACAGFPHGEAEKFCSALQLCGGSLDFSLKLRMKRIKKLPIGIYIVSIKKQCICQRYKKVRSVVDSGSVIWYNYGVNGI